MIKIILNDCCCCCCKKEKRKKERTKQHTRKTDDKTDTGTMSLKCVQKLRGEGGSQVAQHSETHSA